MKYIFIEKYQVEFSIKAMCRVLCVARSCWYAWCLRRPQLSHRQQFQCVFNEAVCKVFVEANSVMVRLVLQTSRRNTTSKR